jgi:hypothetical protein
MSEELIKEDERVTVTLGGVEYVLTPLNLNTMEAIEDAFNISFENVGELAKNKRMSTTKKLLNILLREYKQDPDEVGKLVTMKNLSEITDAIAKILSGG